MTDEGSQRSGRFRIEFDLTSLDLLEFARHTALETAEARRRLWTWRAFAVVLFMLPWASGFALDPRPRVWFAWIIIAGAVLIPAWCAPLIVFNGAARIAADRDAQEANLIGHWVFTVDDTGLQYCLPIGSGSLMWSAVRKVDSAPAGVYLFSQPRRAYVVPRRAFSDESQRAAFVLFCEAHLHGASA